MSVGKICVRVVQMAGPGETAREGARRMAAENVGTLVVVDRDLRPIGVVTDRDVAVHCVAEGRDADRTTLEDIMARPVVTVRETTAIEDALLKMARDKVRRLVVIDPWGHLAGVLALDDVLELLAEEAATIGRLLSRNTRPLS